MKSMKAKTEEKQLLSQKREKLQALFNDAYANQLFYKMTGLYNQAWREGNRIVHYEDVALCFLSEEEVEEMKHIAYVKSMEA